MQGFETCTTNPLQFLDTRSSRKIRYGDCFGYLKIAFYSGGLVCSATAGHLESYGLYMGIGSVTTLENRALDVVIIKY